MRDSVAIMAVDTGPEPRTSTSSPLSVAVTWMSSGFPIEISGSASAQAASIAPSRCGSRIGQRSIGTMSCEPGRGKSDLENVMRSHPRVQRDAAAADAMGIDQRRDVAIDSGLRQRRDHEFALPGAIRLGVPVLDRAAAADAEMRAERFDPLRACGLDRDQSPAVGMVAGNRRDLDRFAAERVGHIDLAAA